MALSVFEGITIEKYRVVVLRYQVDGTWNAVPVLTINDFKKEYIIEREFNRKGWFYERCMSCTLYTKERWPEMNARLTFSDISHMEV